MTYSAEQLLPGTQRALLHRIATAQWEGRAPSLVAAVRRQGQTVWSGARSCVDGHAPDGDTQFRIGSLTKTFTAVLVLRLRDEGLLDLEDPLEKHLPGTGVGEVTIHQLLGHSAGLGAESPAPWWERTPGTLRPELADVLGEQTRMHSPGHRHHYSNPGYTLMGALVEKVRGASWAEVLRSEILEPLAMHRTGPQPQAPHAGGWAVHPWADVMLPEPAEDLGLMAPAGQLWSTTDDLLRFAAFLAEGDDRVLRTTSVEQMREPSAPGELGDWQSSYGLGLQVVRSGNRTLIGHTGSLPGFLAALWIGVEDDVAAVVLTNTTAGLMVGGVAADLVDIVAEAEPRIPEPWRPLPEVDAELLALTGPWYWGTRANVLRMAPDGGLELGPLQGVGRGARFTAQPDGTWTGLDGYYAGETLRVVRNSDGSVNHLDLGSFVFTREPYDPAAAVPGGVDEGGWRGL
ncbi:beta-lactamase family protein [Streptomyces sp. NBC_00053]|uniref:serine hydrolase domain-containing protein n=1 Tax=unclassified Streptomyces TaxID=2593676 RepID=UPI0022598D72|nr:MULTISPECIES: serine hydrolase domain-containing protein [unclassified Streptomyces]MCX5501776.1 beta-lactamase family protein [Streptomyces sp. NBC_00052]MCX5549688.1 beta-lactamase family protein [Streptomyces sp. NBC_00051]